MITPLNDGLEAYKNASADCWEYFKKHYYEHKTDKQWRELVDDANAVYKRWKDTPLKEYVTKYVLVCQREVEKLSKKPEQVPGQMSLFA